MSITINNINTAYPQALAKPEGVKSIEIEGAFLSVSDSALENFPQESDFRHIAIAGSSSYIRNYTADQLKGTEYFRARYLSSRNESGNWSEWISVVVS